MNWLDNRARIPLPIDEKLPEILQLIHSHQVVICAGDPGCGKTTRVAQAVILAFPEMAVAMTQPRRNTCRWSGKRIAAELGTQIGQIVGLTDELFGVSSRTRIELMAEGTLVNKIDGNKKLPEGLIIVDEVHERSQNMELLLGLIRLYLPQSPKTHLMIMSATMQWEKFSNFFNQAPLVSIKGHSYPIEERIINLLKNEHHTEGVIRSAKTIILSFFKDSLFVTDENKNKIFVHKGSVILLLPGKKDIMAVKTALLKLEDPNRKKKIQVFECHILAPYQAQHSIASQVPDNTLRFVCGTDSLRNSVTVPETVGVIDSLECKRKFVDHTGAQRLKKIEISLADAIQGKNRAGRTQPGFYWPISYKDPLTRKDTYFNLKQWNIPAILRESLDTLALRLIMMGLSLRTFPFLDEIPQKMLDQTIQRLKELELIDENEELTSLGKTFSLKHLEVHEEKMLHAAMKYDVCHEMIILLGSLNEEISFIYHTTPRKRWSPADNDYVEMIYAYRAFKAKQRELFDAGKLRQWCATNQLHYDILVRCDEKMKDLSQKWFKDNLKDFIKERAFDEASVMKALISGNLCSYAIQEGTRYRAFQNLFKVSPSSLCPKDASLIMFGTLHKVDLQGGHNVDLIVHIAAPIKPEWLLEVHPKLFHKKEFGEYFYDPSFDEMRRKEGVFFRWLKLGERSISLPDEIAREQFAHLLASNTMRIVLDSNDEIIKYPIGKQEIDEVLFKNKEAQLQADNLNLAIGKKQYKVYSFEELKNHYKEKLNGARNCTEIADINALALPLLNTIPKKIFPKHTPLKYKPPRIKVTTFTGQTKDVTQPPTERFSSQ